MGPIGPIAKNQDGTTLVELLVVVGLFALIGVFVLNFMIGVTQSYARSRAGIESEAQVRLAMQRIVFEARRARGFEAGSAFDVNLASSDSYVIGLDMSASGRDPTVFNVANGILFVQQGSGSPVALTSNEVRVTNLIFGNRTRANGRSRNLDISLTVSRPNPKGPSFPDLTSTLESAVELRDITP